MMDSDRAEGIRRAVQDAVAYADIEFDIRTALNELLFNHHITQEERDEMLDRLDWQIVLLSGE